MTTQQKAMALNALARIQLELRDDGTWFILQGVEIKRGHCLEGICVAGNTPEAAIEEYWDRIISVGSDFLVKHSGREDCFACRWNGFMWTPVSEPKAMKP